MKNTHANELWKHRPWLPCLLHPTFQPQNHCLNPLQITSSSTQTSQNRSFFLQTPSGYFTTKAKTTINSSNNLYLTKEASKSFYCSLGVSEAATLSEIKQAYKQLVLKYHLDVYPPDSAKEFTRMFIRIQEAYETLFDPRTRALYDRDLTTQKLYQSHQPVCTIVIRIIDPLVNIILQVSLQFSCHAPKPTLRTWRSFHTSSLKAQSGNDTNIRIVTGKLRIKKFLFRVV